MNICVIGTGYVGLVVGSCFADMGNNVICVDNNINKLNRLRKGIIPIYEPGLEELIKSGMNEKRLIFTTDIDLAIKRCEICFIAVGTPQGDDGHADLSSVFEVAKEIGRSIDGYKVIVNKSTVPVGTADKVRAIIEKETNCEFDVVSNPEFLKQGSAVDDFLNPDRVVIGTQSKRAKEIMQELYSPLMRTGNPIIMMDIKSAEMTKYASNSFLATKISFMNEIANICEKLGADVEMVRVGMSTDDRIGKQFLFPGIGYGGSCFPKDVKALIKLYSDNGLKCEILRSTNLINQRQREIFLGKILDRYSHNVEGKTFAIWGLSFKPKTNDLREAPSIFIIKSLIAYGATVKVFDPKAMETAKEVFKDIDREKISYERTKEQALKDADSLIILTEWNEFKRPDFEKIKMYIRDQIIFDGRNIYDPDKMREKGFEYICVGRN